MSKTFTPVLPLPSNQIKDVLQAAIGRPASVVLHGPVAASVIHPNGFIKVFLGNDELGRRLYLHIWQDVAGDANIHNHRWHFASTVLSGQLMNSTFELEPCQLGQANGQFVAEYTPRAARFNLRDCGRPPVIAIQSDSATHGPGESYHQPDVLLHKVAASAGSVSLVARGMPIRASAIVLTKEREHNSQQESFSNITARDRESFIRSVLAQLT
jgi:hypothetical protein